MNKKSKTEKGFTLIEIVVMLSAIAILVTILTPVVLKYLEDARIQLAEADVKQIAGAVLSLMKDTGQYPGDKSNVDYLFTDGNVITGALGVASPTSASLSTHLLINGAGYTSSGHFKWNGPYVLELKPDPWGNAYIIAKASDLKGNNTTAVWVISAGPDGVFDTSRVGAKVLSDDDIGIRLK